jgi:phosphonate transport system substrate-binding protein
MGFFLKISYYPWITQYVPPQEIKQNIVIFGNALKRELLSAFQVQSEVKVLDPIEVPEQIDLIVSGTCQIALMNPLGYVFANKRNDQVLAEAVALRIIDHKVGSTYFAQIYARADLRFSTPEQLYGHSMAFGTSFSTSNFLIPAYELKKRSIHPLTAFSRVEFLGGHDSVAKAVYEGRVDFGAGHDGVIADLGHQAGYEDAEKILKGVIKSAPIPSDPVAVNVGTAELRRHIRAALISISKKEEVKKALDKFWGKAQGLESISPSEYNILSNAVEALALSENDCLKRI